jgi:glycosyltransferase involved in cell wall biosynthesis
MGPMRILHLIHQYLPEHIGGTELYTSWLSDALNRRGHQVFIFYRRSTVGVGLESRAGPEGHIWAAWAGELSPTRRFRATFGDPALLRAFEQVLDESRPDLVHVQHLMGQPAALIKAIQRRSIPYLITLHDFWWVCANAQLLTNYSHEVCAGPRLCLNCARCALARAGRSELGLLRPVIAGPLLWRNFLLRRIMAGASRLIAPTEFVHDWYAAHGAPVDRLVTLSHGLESSPVLPTRTRKASDPVRFAYIGGLSFPKGVHVLIEAFTGLPEKAELWIAGDETADPAYTAHLRELASDRVRFLGQLTHAQVWEILAQVDVVTVPSLWYETFAFVVSEAFAAGVPVVASRLGPLADRVRDGVDGLLVPPGEVEALREALHRFQQDSSLQPRLLAGIRPIFTLTEHVNEVEAHYQAIIQEDRN